MNDAFQLGRVAAKRFFSIYGLLFFMWFPIWWMPGLSWLEQRYAAGWDHIVVWVGQAILRFEHPIDVTSTGSGDTLANYVSVLCLIVLACGATLGWMLVDREAKSGRWILGLARVWVRYSLATTMISYGLNKVLYLQFSLSELHLMQQVGDLSPMGLLWMFMGYSEAYNVITGGVEVVGGMLLFWRRTTSLGALVSIVALSNVVALNFCYDVPVKLKSTHYLLACFVLLLPDTRRLIDVLVFNRATEPRVEHRAPTRPWLRWSLRVVKYGFIVWSCYTDLSMQLPYRDTNHHPRHGMYEVSEFVRDGEPVPNLANLDDRWRYVYVSQRHTSIRIYLMDGQSFSYNIQGESEDEWKLASRYGRVPDGDLKVKAHSDPGSDIIRAIEVEGSIGSQSISATLRRIEREREHVLMSRGFRWVSDKPFNN